MADTGADAKPRKKVPVFALLATFIFVVVIIALPVGLVVGGLQERGVTTPVPNGITTTGRVIGVRVDAITGRGGGSEYAEIRFTDRDGTSHEFEATSVSNAPDVGSTVTVSYDPTNPDIAADLSVGSARWITFVTAGVILALLEIFWAYWSLIRKRRKGSAGGA